MLAKDLPRIAAEAADPGVRALAARAHAKYLYPVDSQVYSPEGELLDHVCANDLFEEPLALYHELLDAAAPSADAAQPR